MLVELDELGVQPDTVCWVTTISRQVAAYRRSTTAERPICAITTRIERLRELDVDPKHIHGELYGCTYLRPNGTIIWINPLRTYPDGVQTLCHEMVHALSSPQVVHSRTFRGLYVALLPFFSTLFKTPHSTAIEAERVVRSYARFDHRQKTESYTERRERREREVTAHLAASQRSWKKFNHLVR